MSTIAAPVSSQNARLSETVSSGLSDPYTGSGRAFGKAAERAANQTGQVSYVPLEVMTLVAMTVSPGLRPGERPPAMPKLIIPRLPFAAFSRSVLI